MARRVGEKKAVKLDELLRTVCRYASLRHLSSCSVFYMREFETVGEQSRGKRGKKNSYGSLSCLISGSMTPSPCQPLLSPWKPALLHRQVREKPPLSPRCGALWCVCVSCACPVFMPFERHLLRLTLTHKERLTCPIKSWLYNS